MTSSLWWLMLAIFHIKVRTQFSGENYCICIKKYYKNLFVAPEEAACYLNN